MPSIKALSTYDGYSTNAVLSVTLHEARVAIAAAKGASPTVADIANDGNKKPQRASKVG